MCSCDIRGSSPSSRELALLHTNRKLTEVHAILLTGGSAFGLAAADGVVSWLEQRGTGYQTPRGPVPIVPAAVIFDLGPGDAAVRPGAEQGRAACDASSEDFDTGPVGAGTGATVGKWAGLEHSVRGGLGAATVSDADATVSALAVVNSVGDVLAEDGEVLAGTRAPAPSYRPALPPDDAIPTSTVLAIVATRANLGKRSTRWLAARGADGITTTIRPAHTRYDGDVVFAVAAPASGSTGDEPSPTDLDVLGYLATRAVAGAVRNSVSPPT